MLTSIDLDLLAHVSGGQNVDTVRVGTAEQSSTRTDQAYCVDMVAQSCQAASPGLLGFGTDNTKAAQCMAVNVPKACNTTSTGGATP